MKRLSLRISYLRKKLQSPKFTSRIIFFFVGISSTIWFLLRVIPKPQRAGYPCMRAAAPFMSAFVVYLLSLGGSVLIFKKAMSKFRQGSYVLASLALIISFVLVGIFTFNDAEDVLASVQDTSWERGTLPEGPNSPIGESWGVFPGRVAWVWDPEATNEYCTNTIVTSGGGGWWGGGSATLDDEETDAFFQEKNNNQTVINEMADKTILAVGGGQNIADSWDAIFKSFNNKRKGIDAGYTEGQTIFIRINNGQSGHAINSTDLSAKGFYSQMTNTNDAAITETSPATVLAYVRQLVDECGIPQNMIYIGEPMNHVYKSVYDLIHAEYPNIKILDKEDRTSLGRTKSKGWEYNVIKYSDKGTVMPDAISDALMKEMYNADYMISISVLKAHARAGITSTAKLHFGSHGRNGSEYMHVGLISTKGNDAFGSGVRGDYGMYRVLTDYMGHEKLGLNTALFIVDGLWGGVEATDMPVWWEMEPFYGDFPNSLFVSQDAVALESVLIDFLRAEADDNELFNDRPFFPAVDDHLHQAASKENWADGITYDPEGDGSEMPASIGVHEHWNNPDDKQYTKNLDPLAVNGIELYNPDDYTSTKKINNSVTEIKVFPNPTTDYAEINFSLKNESMVEFDVVSTNGQIIHSYSPQKHLAGQQSLTINTSSWTRGSYIIRMQTISNSNVEVSSTKLIVN